MAVKTKSESFSKPVKILLVEDNLGEVSLTQETLKDFTVRNLLSVAGDGAEAMAFLRREGCDGRVGTPFATEFLASLDLSS